MIPVTANVLYFTWTQQSRNTCVRCNLPYCYNSVSDMGVQVDHSRQMFCGCGFHTEGELVVVVVELVEVVDLVENNQCHHWLDISPTPSITVHVASSHSSCTNGSGTDGN